MSKPYDKPISIQRINEATEEWEDVFKLHAYINKASQNNEYQNAGAIQDKVAKTFEVRYFKALKDIEFNTQLYRIIYDGNAYNITDYDDFKEAHITVKLLGVC